jgi:hypothetical protein
VVVPLAGDYDVTKITGAAPLNSPVFTGTPAGPTPAVDNSTTLLATTAFVLGQLGSANPLIDGTAAPGTSTRMARQDHVHPTDTTRSPVNNPVFTGIVTYPLIASTTNCGAVGSAANPSLVACAAAPAVTANSEIDVHQVSYLNSRLSVTCNTASALPAGPLVTAISAGTSFTITLGTFTANPACFVFKILN